MAAATRLYLFWDTGNGAIPGGWTEDTDYRTKFIRGVAEADAIGTGGSDTHNHTLSSLACSNQSATCTSITSTPDASPVHNHGTGSLTCDNFATLPAYRVLVVIYAGTATVIIPQNAITWFDNDNVPGSGFTSYTSANSKYVRGGAATADGGSAANHSHGIGGSLDANPDMGARSGAGAGAAATNHTHGISSLASDSDAVWAPSRFERVLYTSNNNQAFPNDMVAGFNGTLPANWTSISESGQDPYQKLLYADVAEGTGGGAHSHNLSSNTDGPSATKPQTGSGMTLATGTHTHTITGTLDASDPFPAYRDMIFAKYSGGAGPGAVGKPPLSLNLKPRPKGGLGRPQAGTGGNSFGG